MRAKIQAEEFVNKFKTPFKNHSFSLGLGYQEGYKAAIIDTFKFLGEEMKKDELGNNFIDFEDFIPKFKTFMGIK